MWNRKVHHYLTTELVEKRNDGDIQAFTRMGVFMRQKDPRSLVRLLLLSEKVALCIKRGELKEAHSLLSRFDEFDKEDEVQILEVIKLYLESRLERAQGDYKKSYDIAEVALSKAELIAPEPIWLLCCRVQQLTAQHPTFPRTENSYILTRRSDILKRSLLFVKGYKSTCDRSAAFIVQQHT